MLLAAEESPKQTAAAVSGLPEKALLYKPVPDKWCILDILGHLADMEVLYAYRIRQMLADQDPVIALIDQDAWAKNLGYLESPAPELVAPLWTQPPRQCAIAQATERRRLAEIRKPS